VCGQVPRQDRFALKLGYLSGEGVEALQPHDMDKNGVPRAGRSNPGVVNLTDGRLSIRHSHSAALVTITGTMSV
jgi:hypothetical protein